MAFIFFQKLFIHLLPNIFTVYGQYYEQMAVNVLLKCTWTTTVYSELSLMLHFEAIKMCTKVILKGKTL